MANLERSKNDSGYNAHVHYFLGKVRQGGNPQYASAPAHLRLGLQVNWTSDDISDEHQAVSGKSSGGGQHVHPPRKHKDPFTGTKEVVDIHTIICWVLPEENEQIRREMEEMDQ